MFKAVKIVVVTAIIIEEATESCEQRPENVQQRHTLTH